MKARYVVKRSGGEVEVEAESLGGGRYRVKIGEREHLVERRGGAHAPLLVAGPLPSGGTPAAGGWTGVATRVHRVELDGRLPQLSATLGDWSFPIELVDARRRLLRGGGSGSGAAEGPFEVRAPMAGRVVKLLVERGQPVQAGQGLIIIEAMKMENELKSPQAGVVQRLDVAEGSAVEPGATLLVVEPATKTATPAN